MKTARRDLRTIWNFSMGESYKTPKPLCSPRCHTARLIKPSNLMSCSQHGGREGSTQCARWLRKCQRKRFERWKAHWTISNEHRLRSYGSIPILSAIPITTCLLCSRESALVELRLLPASACFPYTKTTCPKYEVLWTRSIGPRGGCCRRRR